MLLSDFRLFFFSKVIYTYNKTVKATLADGKKCLEECG